MTLACQYYDRTAALFSGGASAENVNILRVPAGPVGVAGVIQGVFEAAEMPLSHYVFLKDRDEPFTAIPVFPDRLFVQQYVYTRAGTGIQSAADLRGRKVLVPMYYMTSSLWHRAQLQEAYGIRASEIEWHTTLPERPGMKIPADVKVVRSPGPIFGFERLLDGTVDAIMTEAAPLGNHPEPHKIVPVYRDVQQVQRRFYKDTGAHVIVHLIVLRQEAVKARPRLPEQLCLAFDQAKALCYRQLQDERMTSLPLMRGYIDETLELFGDDPWSYGFERNRAELERFLRYAYEQGMTQRRLDAASLFDNPSKDFRFTARIGGER